MAFRLWTAKRHLIYSQGDPVEWNPTARLQLNGSTADKITTGEVKS
jgi:hypothetical protein